MFMASLAALTNVEIVHYAHVSCLIATFFLSLGSATAFGFEGFEPLVLMLVIGFFVNLGTVSISMTFFGLKNAGLALYISCIVYVVFAGYLFYALYIIIGPRLDYNFSQGKNVLMCITLLYFGWAYVFFRLF